MERPDFLFTLHNMDAAQLRQCIAHASGLLAEQVTGGGAAIILRRVADRLEGHAYRRGDPGRYHKSETGAGVP